MSKKNSQNNNLPHNQNVAWIERSENPGLSIRHILRYLKLNLCTSDELDWFDEMFKKNRNGMVKILWDGKYSPDHRARGGGYGISSAYTRLFSKKYDNR